MTTEWWLQETVYKKYLQSFSEQSLLRYFTKSDFWGIFYPEEIYLLGRSFSDGTPEVFYEFVMEQPVPLIQKLIDYAKSSDKPVHDDTDYQEISLMVYKQVSEQLEVRLQYRLLDEKLPLLKNSNISKI